MQRPWVTRYGANKEAHYWFLFCIEKCSSFCMNKNEMKSVMLKCSSILCIK
jgi:hypothetical protein